MVVSIYKVYPCLNQSWPTCAVNTAVLCLNYIKADLQLTRFVAIFVHSTSCFNCWLISYTPNPMHDSPATALL